MRWAFYIAPMVLGVVSLLDRRYNFTRSYFSGLQIMLAFALGLAISQGRVDYTSYKFSDITFPAKFTSYELTGEIVWAEKHNRRGRLILQTTDMLEEGKTQKPYRVELYTKFASIDILHPGCRVSVKARIARLPSPIIKDGYDPRFAAFFEGKRGRGFLQDIIAHDCASQNETLLHKLDSIRLAFAARLAEKMSTQTSAVAAALTTGIRGAIDKETRNAFRDSGLAHILAISGLHMTLFAGTIYALLRLLGVFLFPHKIIKYDWRKACAIMALLAGFSYLLISGGSIATQRAFIMIGLIFLSAASSRPALSFNNVALAAIIILLWQPQSLFSAGFQMSFAAVIALIWFYRRYGDQLLYSPHQDRKGSLTRLLFTYFIGIALTSLIAGAATGMIAAYHFQRVAVFGLLANILAMPILALIIMPAAVVALLTAGAWDFPLLIMQYGLSLVLDIAYWVSHLPQASLLIQQSPQWVLVVIFLALILITMRQRLSQISAYIMFLAALFALGSKEFSNIHIYGAAYQIAVPSDEGVLKISRNGYETEQFMRAANRPVELCPRNAPCIINHKGQEVWLIQRKENLAAACAKADIIITSLYAAQKKCAVGTLFARQDFTYDETTIISAVENGAGWQLTPASSPVRIWQK